MDKSTTILSPVTHGKSKFLFDIPKESIIDSYKKESSIDIAYLFKQVSSISVYECEDTGYRFFYPFNIDGDGPFYEQLELIPWYYASWKWDYEIAKEYIAEGVKVLDIGCGEAKFLDYLKKEKKCDCIGLELNEKAKEIANKNGLAVKNEMIQDHAVDDKNTYDVVTFFQVLEHISQVDQFLKSAIEVTKPGGTIILAVPNNEPYYLTFDKYHFLNLPPHHMGWWNEKSLKSLSEIYNLELIAIKKQQLEHYTSYAQNWINTKMKLPTVLSKLIFPIVKIACYINRKNINGASILAVYQKK